jgi:preprotein translocase subunit SecG
MINFLQIFFSFLILVILTPQTSELNTVLNIFHESGFFANYGEAKSFLIFLTWFLIFLFFFFSLL